MSVATILANIVRQFDIELPVNVKCFLAWKELAHAYGDLPLTRTGNHSLDALLFHPNETVVSCWVLYRRMISHMTFAIVLSMPKNPEELIRQIDENAYGQKGDLFIDSAQPKAIKAVESFLPSGHNDRPTVLRYMMVLIILFTGVLLHSRRVMRMSIEPGPTRGYDDVARTPTPSVHVDVPLHLVLPPDEAKERPFEPPSLFHRSLAEPNAWSFVPPSDPIQQCVYDIDKIQEAFEPFEFKDAQAEVIAAKLEYIQNIRDNPPSIDDVDQIKRFLTTDTTSRGAFHVVRFHKDDPDTVMKTFPQSELRNLLVSIIVSSTPTSVGLIGVPIQKIVFYDDQFYVFASKLEPFEGPTISHEHRQKLLKGLDDLRKQYGIMWTYANDMHHGNVMYDPSTDTLRVTDTDFFWFFNAPQHNDAEVSDYDSVAKHSYPNTVPIFSIPYKADILKGGKRALYENLNVRMIELWKNALRLRDRETLFSVDFSQDSTHVTEDWDAESLQMFHTTLERTLFYDVIAPMLISQDLGLLPEIVGIELLRERKLTGIHVNLESTFRVLLRFQPYRNERLAFQVAKTTGLPVLWNDKYNFYCVALNLMNSITEHPWVAISRNMQNSLRKRYMELD